MRSRSFLVVIIGLVLLSILNGCSTSKEEAITIKSESKSVLIHDDNQALALTFAAFIENPSNKESTPFYVQFDIENDWLSKELGGTKFIAGKGLTGDKLEGKLYTVKPNTTIQAGLTVEVSGNIDEQKLKESIEQSKAIKVSLLNQDKEVITTSYITQFEKAYANTKQK